MAACGAGKEEAKAADAVAALPANLKTTLEGLAKMDWGKGSDFKGAGVNGTIYKASLAGFPNVWVKSDKVYEGASQADWNNYNKFLAETSATDKTVKGAVATQKNDDGTTKQLWVELKMGTFISNRDMHMQITKYTTDVTVDDMKDAELTVWTDVPEDVKPHAKKVVRMKVQSFCLTQQTAKGFRTIDFDNYDFGGSLPNKVTNQFVGNSADYVAIAGYIANIKKNGGKFKK